MSEETTVVHLLRHGEVFNPDKIFYGRLPGFRLSDLGLRMAGVDRPARDPALVQRLAHVGRGGQVPQREPGSRPHRSDAAASAPGPQPLRVTANGRPAWPHARLP